MAIKKSELYSSLWASCDELRGGMDASQYKDYVLVLLFVKYVSDKYADVAFAPITIPEGASFKDMIALKGKSDIGDQINKRIIAPLAEANKLSDMPDFNDATKLGTGKEMVDRLTNLISIFENPALDFSKNRADGDDILGDAYEYLMRHFATESGKSKGQFYTPAEVSRIMAQALGIRDAETTNDTTVYDPTCGSGSLLLKVGDAASAKVTLYGQEKDAATAGLARMNMILHNNPTAVVRQGNTLASPHFTNTSGNLKTFDYVVANPPFSDKRWSTGLDPANDPYGRFAHFGVPPAKQGDFAYLLHIVSSLTSTGKGACILPHGVLFRGNAEQSIRKNLVQRGYIKAIIGLPANLFYGTGIPACIVVIDKEHATVCKGIFLIDASKGFIKDGPKNRLREQDIHKIVDTFTRQTEVSRYARMVPVAEISDPKNDFNLNLPRYIDSTEPEDRQDINAHLRGGIPECDVDALDDYWRVMPDLRACLFTKSTHPGYCELSGTDIRSAIFGHEEFAAFKTGVDMLFSKWRDANAPCLKGFGADTASSHPKVLVETLSEALLVAFEQAPLLDHYDIYQHLMDYWFETMQDDCYLIASDGWVAKPHRVIETVKSGKKKGQEKDKGWACDLVPKQLVVARYYPEEQAAIDSLKADLTMVDAELEELAEENGGEEGVLKDVSSKADAEEAYRQALLALWNEEDKQASDAYSDLVTSAEHHGSRLRMLSALPGMSALKNPKGKVTLKSVKARLATLPTGDEHAALSDYLKTDKDQKGASKEARKRLSSIESVFLSTLCEDPLPETYGDLRASVQCLKLLETQTALKAEIKEAESALDALALGHYDKLTEDEIKTLAVDDKWLPSLATAVQGELDRVSQTLTGRIRQLTERYATPLPQLSREVATLASRVKEHLQAMGAAWE